MLSTSQAFLFSCTLLLVALIAVKILYGWHWVKYGILGLRCLASMNFQLLFFVLDKLSHIELIQIRWNTFQELPC